MAKANDRKEKVAEEFLDQDVYQPVPMGERAAWYSFLAIFIGMWASLAAMGAGVDLGLKLTPWKASLGLFLGYMVCLAYGYFVGEVGRREGLSTPALFGRPFSPLGRILPALFVFGIAGIFIGVQADAVGRVVMDVFGWEEAAIAGFVTNRAIFSAVLCAIMMVTAYFGIRYIKIVSWVALPFYLGVLVVALVLGVKSYPGGLSGILTTEAHEVGFEYAFFLGVALYAGFSALLPDVTRFVRTRGGLIKALVIGYILSTFIPIWGAVIANVHGVVYWKVFSMYGIAFGVVAAIALFFAQWTTNDNNCFASGLSLSTIFRALNNKWEKVPRLNRKGATLVPAIVGVVLAFVGTGAIAPLLMFVGALGAWLPPMAGVFIAHFWVVEKRSKAKIETKGLAGLVAWIAISLLVHLGIMPWAAITGVLGSFLLYLILYYGVEARIWGENIVGEQVKEESA